MKDIQGKVNVIIIDLEFNLSNSHSINQAWPLLKHYKKTRQIKEPPSKNNILDILIVFIKV